MNKLKVSVLIPTYNQQDVVEQTLMSTLEQDYDQLEVIVSDDASTDRTPGILKSLQGKYSGRLKVFLHQANLGVTKNHTRGLMECDGDYVAFQDGDDIFLPGKIQKQISFMQERKDCTISFHDVDVFDSITGKSLYLWSHRFGRRNGGIKTLVRYGNYLPSVSVMVRRSNLPEYGYDDRIRIGSDWLLWLDVLSRGKGRICYIDEVLARYRRHPGNLTNESGWKYEDQMVTLALIATKWPDLLSAARLRLSEIQFMQALSALSNKRFSDASHFLWGALVAGFPFAPWSRLIWRELLFLWRYQNADDSILRSIVS